jgi:uncharacterized membrane protein YagU involved in acid resistance
MNRVVHGAIAGFCATMAMTIAMRAFARELDPVHRYPLPPREITEDVLHSGRSAPMTTVLAHFGFGAVAGALYGLLPPRMPGLIYGPAVWAASYLGWVPAAHILVPATRHPAQRNLLMIAVHLVWGACLAVGTRELERASNEIFVEGPLRDRDQEHRS